MVDHLHIYDNIESVITTGKGLSISLLQLIEKFGLEKNFLQDKVMMARH